MTTTTDEQALERYRYMLATAPPDAIERAHAEAFARLTPEQRRQALQALAAHVPPSELHGDDPAALARTATRAEIREPGTIERAWGAGGAGFGLGSLFLTTLAGSFIGTAVAQAFFADTADAGGAGPDAAAGPGSEGGDAPASEAGWSEEPGGQVGDDASTFEGDIGGDLGGGDFGDLGF